MYNYSGADLSWQKYAQNMSASNVVASKISGWGNVPTVVPGIHLKKWSMSHKVLLNNVVKPSLETTLWPRAHAYPSSYHRSNHWHNRASPSAIQKWIASLVVGWSLGL